MKISRDLRVAILAALLALIVRLPIVLTEESLSTRFSMIGDMTGYSILARNLAEEGTLTYTGEPTAFRSPLYPVFLSLFYVVSPDNFRLYRMVQSVLFISIVPFLTLLLGKRIVGRRAATLAVLLVALYPPFVHYSTELLSESLAIVLFPLAYWLYLRWSKRPRIQEAFALGACSGLILLIRPNFLIAMALLVAAVLILGPATRSKRIRSAIALLVAAAAVIAPWAIRNAIVFGAFVPFNTMAGYVWLDGAIYLRSEDWDSHKEELRRMVGYHRGDIENENSQPMDELEFDRVCREKALAVITEEPRSYAFTLLYNTGVTLFGINRIDLSSDRSGREWIAFVVGKIPYLALLLLAGVYLVRARFRLRGHGGILLIVAFVGTITSIPLIAGMRYRVPALDLLIILLAARTIADWRFAAVIESCVAKLTNSRWRLSAMSNRGSSP